MVNAEIVPILKLFIILMTSHSSHNFIVLNSSSPIWSSNKRFFCLFLNLIETKVDYYIKINFPKINKYCGWMYNMPTVVNTAV